ncbi:hypothetical protein DPEC_G00265100 [Dallia pectoralis]|uniref:Uncharacterized protein n=1 Tax=Dallia pectoralis TaxID=75939 RepID=A0ACC2FT08_DALPE|nr:hypothetical protein DPEC_G00265100 [Dallia pectoralis]
MAEERRRSLSLFSQWGDKLMLRRFVDTYIRVRDLRSKTISNYQSRHCSTSSQDCFYEDITIGTKCTLEFQVVTGGHYDVDCRLEDSEGTVLYKEMKKQYDSFTFTAAKNGTYKFCFSNEFSTFTHKTVYFDFQIGEDPPLFPNENRVTALTQMESACVSIHEALKSVIDYQTHFRLREAQGRSRAEDLNTRVAFWSIGEAFILLVVSISQVVLLRSFFSDRKTTTTRVGS